MIALPTDARVWLATGHTDMRKGYQSLALLVQETLKRDPNGGHLFVFRGRRGDLGYWLHSWGNQRIPAGRQPVLSCEWYPTEPAPSVNLLFLVRDDRN